MCASMKHCCQIGKTPSLVANASLTGPLSFLHGICSMCFSCLYHTPGGGGGGGGGKVRGREGGRAI